MSEAKDIFISYRRDGGEFLANLLYLRLTADGYRVFLDIESLRSGKFNEQLFQVIEACTDLLLILPPKGLDRCADPSDWVRLELEHATNLGKNIIPVMMRDFRWPETLPEKLRDIPLKNGVTADTELFDGVISRLEKKLLLSRIQSVEDLPLSQQLQDRFSHIASDTAKTPLMQIMAKKKEDRFIHDFANRNIQKPSEAADNLPDESDPSENFGLSFTLYDREGDDTIVYRAKTSYDRERLVRYCEPDRLIRSSEQEAPYIRRTYYIPPEDLQDDFLALIFLTFRDCGEFIEVYINTGALQHRDVKIATSPKLFSTFDKPAKKSLDGYFSDSLTEDQKELYESGQCIQKYHHEVIGPLNNVLIDPITLESPRRELYFDEEKQEFAARVKLKSNYTYFTFQLKFNDSPSGTEPMTDLEIGSVYRTGSHGFPKDLLRAGSYLEKDGSAEALYQIGLMFQNEEEIRDEEIAASYFQRAAALESAE